MKIKILAKDADFTLVAWDYDERLYKKIHFLSKPIFEKYDVEPQEMKSEWPHISSALVEEPTYEERNKIKLAASLIKPKFQYKQLEIFPGQKQLGVDYFAIEFNVPIEFQKFIDFLADVCGSDRVKQYKVHRPHVSIWAIRQDQAALAKKALPEIQKEVKNFLQPFVPKKISLWDNFEISEIESIGSLIRRPTWQKQIKNKYKIIS